MQVTEMMRLYTAVVLLVWTVPHAAADLNYANSALTSVPAAVDNGNLDANTLKVDLSGNQLSTFVNDLTCCTQISELDLSNNAITSITISRTSNLVITKLTLTGNNLNTSPQISSEVANNLEELWLDDNSLTSLDPTLLVSLLKLNILSIRRNQFSIFPDFTASGHSMTNFAFTSNLLTNCTAMHNIGSLQRIDLTGNSIAEFPKTIGQTSLVTSFNLYENLIQVVPDEDLIVFTALHYIDISRNRLTQFPNISVVGQTLEYIYLWGNTISNIDSSIFNNAQVIKLISLAGNGLTDFPDMGPTAGRTLETLDLNHNALTDSSADVFYSLEALTLLNLQVNHFTRVPNISTSNLINLQLGQNSILSGGLSALSGKKISHLDLSDNSITTLTALGLEATLQELNLKGNPISSIDSGALTGYTLINTVDLTDATFTSIPDMTDVTPLLTLKIENVPLTCDCYASWLTSWTASASGRVLVISANPCQQPPSLVNVAWASVQLDPCPDVTTVESLSTIQVETTTEYITSTAAGYETTMVQITTVQDADTSTVEQTTTRQTTAEQITTEQATSELTTTAQDTSALTTAETSTAPVTQTASPNTTYNTSAGTVSSTTGCDANAETTLISNLLNNYDISARPVLNESDAVVVKLGLALKQILILNEREQELVMKVWMRYTWTDASLTWNASENCGVSSVRIFPYRIWRPDITLYDDLDEDPDDNDARMFPAEVQSDGTVLWYVPKMISSNCDVDMRYYPWDEQRCILKFGSWTYDGSALDLLNRSASGDLDYYTSSGEWNVVEFSVKRNNVLYNCCPNPYPDVTFTLLIRRKPTYYLFNLILPAIFVTATTLLVFYLPPESGEKVSLGVTVLLAIIVFLLLVAETVPRTETVPLIGQFFGATIIMLALSSALTVVTLNVHYRGVFGSEVPYWVRKLVLDWMARPLCLKSKVDEHLSSIRSNKVAPLKTTKVKMGDDAECEDGVILVQEKTEEIEVVNHNRTETEQSLRDILGVLRGFQEGKRSADHKKSCQTEWQLVAVVIDRFFLCVFVVLTAAVTAIILSNHPYYAKPVLG